MTDTRTLMTRLEDADKLLRKGELAEARSIYASLIPGAPPDLAAALQQRLQRVDDLLDPQEAKTSRPAADNSAQARAEAAANAGEFDQAIEIYAELVASRPDDQLARERLTELLGQKSRAARNRQAPPARVVSDVDSANAASASTQESGPLGAALHKVEEDPEEALEEVLDVEEVLEPEPVPASPPAAAAPPPAAADPGSLLQVLLSRVTANRRAPSRIGA